jgi:polysaccharide export outer membrane protein
MFLAGCNSDKASKNIDGKMGNAAAKTAIRQYIEGRNLDNSKFIKELETSVVTPNPGSVPPDPEATPNVYELKIGDTIEISVLDEPEMTREVSVIPDGSITYLLIGEVDALGKTLAELRKEIEGKLGQYYVSTRVSILTKKVQYEKKEDAFASIIGAVKSPGKYQLDENETLVDFVSKSGGFLFVTDNLGGRSLSNLKASYLSRDGKKMNIDFYALFEEGKMQNNIKMQANDFVYIANAQTELIYVLGQVNNPQLISYNRPVTVVEALAASGGFTEQAQRSRVIIVRGPGEENHINVDVEALLLGDLEEKNVLLKSGDIVFVPEQGLSEYSRYARYLIDFADLILRGYQVREAILFPKLHRD